MRDPGVVRLKGAVEGRAREKKELILSFKVRGEEWSGRGVVREKGGEARGKK